MIFRVLDIETVPDPSAHKPNHLKWDFMPFSAACEQGREGAIVGSTGNSSTFDSMVYVEQQPMYPPHAQRVVAIAWCDIEIVHDMERKDAEGKGLRIYRFANFVQAAAWSKKRPDHTERELIANFADEMAKIPATVVTWNGRQFDLPVLNLRALKLGVPWPWYYAERGVRYRYSEEGHVDLMDVFSDYGACRFAKLDEIAKLIGLPGKTDMDGSKVADIVALGDDAARMAEVRRYCGHDVLQTALVFIRSRFHMGRVTPEGYKDSLTSFHDVVTRAGLPVEWDKLEVGS